MKRIAALLATAFFLCILSAQEHMTFKGIEIDGTTKEMTLKLKELGYIYDEDASAVEGMPVFKGKFAGYDAVITFTTYNENVYGVGVHYRDNLYSWPAIKERFDNLEKNLIRKYGNPALTIKEIEEWSDELIAIRDREGQWMTRWNTDKGSVLLYVYVSQKLEPCVVLGYLDSISMEKIQQQAYDDL